METLRFLFTASFYPPYHIGGDAVHVKYLADALAKIGHDVHVLSSLDAYEIKTKKYGYKKTHTKDLVNTYEIQTKFNSSAYLSYITGSSKTINLKLADLIKKVNPDVVHHHNISLLGYKILKKQGDYFNAYTAHDYWLICPKSSLLNFQSKICLGGSCFFCQLRDKRPPQLWRLGGAFQKVVNTDVDLVISPSIYTRDQINKKMPFSNHVVIPNFASKPPISDVVAEYSDFYLYAGVLEEHKGLLKLVNLVKQKDVNIKLLIIGQGSLKEKLSQIVKTNHLEKKVVLLGWVTSDILYRLLSIANALIVPSMWAENSPLIVLEALSVGTPVISSDYGGLPEIVGKLDKRLIFRNIDELRDLFHNYSKNDYPKETVKRIYLENFSPEVYIRQYLRYLNRT